MDKYKISHDLDKIHLLKRIYLQKRSVDLPIHPKQIPLLNYVKLHNGCTQIEIAENLLVTPASVALSTKRMEKSGFLRKEVDDTNLRCKKIYITEEGIKLLELSKTHFHDFDNQLFNGFSEEELATFKSYIERALSNIENEHSDKSIPALINIVKSNHKKEDEKHD